MNLHRIAQKLLNRPLLVAPAAAEAVYSVIAPRIGAEPVEPAAALPDRKPRASRLDGLPVGEVGEFGEIREEWYRLHGSVAVVTLEGELVNRGAWVGASSGLTSYEGFAFAFGKAAADPRVKEILLDIDSPGGEAVGAMETAEHVRKASRSKPVTALVNGMAASAAYAIASGAGRIVTIPSGLVGSIGVVLLHMDVSAEMEMKGRKPTLIHAGAHKVDGHPFGPLPDAVRAVLQAEVDAFYSDFVNAVARHRPGLTAAKVRATEARIFKGADAVAAGLADAVETYPALLASLQKRAGAVSRGSKMSDVTDTIPRADHERLVAAARTEAHAAGKAEGLAQGRTEATASERARLSAILGLEEAKGREATATKLALTSDMSPEACADILKSVPAATGPSALDKLKATAPSIDLGNPPPADAAAAREAAARGWGKAVAAANASIGVK